MVCVVDKSAAVGRLVLCHVVTVRGWNRSEIGVHRLRLRPVITGPVTAIARSGQKNRTGPDRT